MEICSLQVQRSNLHENVNRRHRGKTAVELGVEDYQTCIREVGDMSVAYFIW